MNSLQALDRRQTTKVGNVDSGVRCNKVYSKMRDKSPERSRDTIGLRRQRNAPVRFTSTCIKINGGGYGAAAYRRDTKCNEVDEENLQQKGQGNSTA